MWKSAKSTDPCSAPLWIILTFTLKINSKLRKIYIAVQWFEKCNKLNRRTPKRVLDLENLLLPLETEVKQWRCILLSCFISNYINLIFFFFPGKFITSSWNCQFWMYIFGNFKLTSIEIWVNFRNLTWFLNRVPL